MPESQLRLIRRWAEFRRKDELKSIPLKRRGIYGLYCQHRKGGEAKIRRRMCWNDNVRNSWPASGSFDQQTKGRAVDSLLSFRSVGEHS